MSFANELDQVLPEDLPHRDAVVAICARHLELVEEANQQFNLTRVTSPREAAIKHVADSVIPWMLFARAKKVLDIGSGAGFPGIPLAVVLPEVRFTLSESTQKKARFLESAVSALELPNVRVTSQRAEDLLKAEHFDLVTARAVAPLSRALVTFAPWKPGVRGLFYKGPDAEAEIAEATAEARKRQVHLEVAMTYTLPDDLGSRTVVEISR